MIWTYSPVFNIDDTMFLVMVAFSSQKSTSRGYGKNRPISRVLYQKAKQFTALMHSSHSTPGGNYLSRSSVTTRLEQPTRELESGALKMRSPIRPCSRRGLATLRLAPQRRGLLHHDFTLIRLKRTV